MSAPLDMPLSDAVFIAEFAAFCRGKGDEAYDYDCSVNCAVAQFVRDTGRSNGDAIGHIWYYDQHGKSQAIPCGVSPAADAYPQTFSALADRLEALIADRPAVRTA